MPRATVHAEVEKGAPRWMLTFGDSITLLLTFFVMMLSFSTPNEEDYAKFKRGMFSSATPGGVLDEAENQSDLTPEEHRLMSSRVDIHGAEKPPVFDNLAPEDVVKYHPELDVAELPHVPKSTSIRMAVADLFGEGETLTQDGEQILNDICKLLNVETYKVIICTRAASGQSEDLALKCSMQMQHYLRSHAMRKGIHYRLSADEQLVGAPLPEGSCEVILMED